MAESGDARKADVPQVLPQPPQQIQILQPKQDQTSSKALDVPGNNEVSTQQSNNLDIKPEPKPLPKWFRHFFPLLSTNETFIILYWYLVAIYSIIKNAFLVDLLMKWVKLVLLIWRPAIKLLKLVWWFVYSLSIRPAMYVTLSIASLFGITDAVGAVVATLIAATDFYGDKIVTTVGSVLEYIKAQWSQVSKDLKEAYAKLIQWATETLEAIVQATKYTFSYVSDMLAMIMPAAFHQWLLQWLHFGWVLLTKLYGFIKCILTSFERALEIIISTWDHDLKESGFSEPKKVFSAPVKQMEPKKPSQTPPKPTPSVLPHTSSDEPSKRKAKE